MKSTCYRRWNSFRAENQTYVLVIQLFWSGKKKMAITLWSKGENKFVIAINMNSNQIIFYCPPPPYVCVILVWVRPYPPCTFLCIYTPCCVSYELCYNIRILLCFHQTRTIWCYCSDKVYLYQLMVKSGVFYTLMEWCAVVNKMLLMLSGDIESNPGPGEYVYS